MYITIRKKPSKEEIDTYNIKVSEQDSIIDYRIELASFDQGTKKALCESYNLKPESIENTARIILSYNTEV